MKTIAHIFLILFLLCGFINSANATYKEMTSQERQAFIEEVAEAVNNRNEEILKIRQRLLFSYALWQVGQPLSVSQIAWLQHLINRYDIGDQKGSELSEKDWQLLLRRVDIVPVSLAVAQAINESAWGRSRFAKEGNNYFGQWCYTEGCGLVPLKRSEGAAHEVKKFSSLSASVDGYIKNLNTHDSYKGFRIEREKARTENESITGLELLPYLDGYSQIGSEYTQYIQSIIKANNLEDLDQFSSTN